MLSTLVDLAHRMAGDIAAYGAESGAACSDLAAVLHRSAALLARASVELQRGRECYLAAQLERIAVPERGARVHLGAGENELEGWINVDVAPAQLAMDLRWGLPFADGGVERVFLSHFLEHLSRREARRLLDEIRRVLSPGGAVRIVVPDFRRYAEAYVAGDREFFEEQRKHWPWAADMKTDLERILEYAAGADADPRSFMVPHRYGYDFETLALALREAGFSRVEQSAFMSSRHPELRIDDRTAYAAVSSAGRSFSLFVEATP